MTKFKRALSLLLMVAMISTSLGVNDLSVYGISFAGKVVNSKRAIAENEPLKNVIQGKSEVTDSSIGEGSVESVKVGQPTEVSVEVPVVPNTKEEEALVNGIPYNEVIVIPEKVVMPIEIMETMIVSSSAINLSVPVMMSAAPSGTGIKEDPFLIFTVDDLKKMNTNSVAHYKMMNDLDLVGVNWEPVGKNTPFTGSLDGNGFTISNMKIIKITPQDNYVGLFSQMQGEVRNLIVKNAEVEANNCAGIIAGYASNGVIKNITVLDSRIKSMTGYVGSVVGLINGAGSALEQIKVKGTEVGVINIGQFIGGIAGQVTNTKLSKLSFEGAVHGLIYVGGIVGSLNSSAKLSESQSFGIIEGNGNVGGLVGSLYAATIENSMTHSTIKTTETGATIGGLFATGVAPGSVTNCYFAGKIEGYSQAKIGTIGGSYGSGNIVTTNSYYDCEKFNAIARNTTDIPTVTKKMLQKSNYSGWDFTSIWEMKDGKTYPKLKCYEAMVDSTIGIMTSGEGTKEKPFEIKTVEQLKMMAYDTSSHYKLMNDLDLTGVNWEPVGKNTPFTGSLDGNGFTISNMKIIKITPQDNYVGLFSQMQGEVRNLIVKNAEVEANNCAGIIAGYASNGVIKNITVLDSRIKSMTGYVGSVVGLINGAGSALEQIKVKGTEVGVINIGQFIGGIAGQVTNTKLSKLSFEGAVHGLIYVGGIVGSLNSSAKLSESQSFGIIEGQGSYIGGLVGYIGGSSIENSMSHSTIKTTAYGNAIGGLFGTASAPGSVTNCYFAGKIEGYSQAQIATIGGCYGSGNIVPTNSYYDCEKFNAIARNTTDIPTVTKKMLQKSNYSGWDFTSIWEMKDGKTYPKLKCYEAMVDSTIGIMISGEGTKEKPFEIKTVEQLKMMAYDTSSHYKLMNDLDLTGVNWEPVGKNTPFTGSLDGNGFTISNMKIIKITPQDNYVGLFSQMQGEVRNLIVKNAEVEANNCAGIIAGYASNGVIKNITVLDSRIKSMTGYVGSVVGLINGAGSALEQIKVKGTEVGVINIGQFIGGIAGQVTNTKLSKLSFEGAVHGLIYVGGIVGSLNSSAKLSESQSFGIIEGQGSYIGGLVGYIGGSSIENSMSHSTIKTTAYGNAIGGLFGTASAPGSVTNCYFAGKIEGYSQAQIATIGGCYGSGNIVPTNSYYDTEKSLLKQRNANEGGRTTKELFKKSNYTSWDFDKIWLMKDGKYYPILKNVQFAGGTTEFLFAPDEIKITDIASKSFKVSWKAADNSTDYDIQIGEKIYTTKNLEYQVTGLEPDTNYQVKLLSKNSTDSSQWSEVKSGQTLTSSIATPKITEMKFNNDQLLINWTAVAGIKKYELYINGEVIPLNTVKGTYTLKNIKQNTLYQVKVRAIGLKDQSKWSDEMNKKSKDAMGMLGQGTDVDPYIIMEQAHFKRLETEPSAVYMVGQNILLTGDWKPLCIEKPFTGKLLGNQKIISGLRIIQKTQAYVGFISWAQNAEISDLVFETPIVTSESSYVSVLLGKADVVRVENVKIRDANVEGNQYVAGLIGLLNDANPVSKSWVRNCVVETSQITCKTSYAAGLIANANNANIKNCQFDGKVISSSDYLSGLIATGNKLKIEICKSTGQINGKSYLAGIASTLTNSSLENVYSRMNLVSVGDTGTAIAGLVSSFASDNSSLYFIKNCYYSGKLSKPIQANIKVAGIAYSVPRTDCVINSYFDGFKIGFEAKYVNDIAISRLSGAMKSKSNYEGWDFEKIWTIDENISCPNFIENDSSTPDDGDQYKKQPLGSGTESSPYLLAIPEHFKFIEIQPNAFYKVAQDIDFVNDEWMPLCKEKSFSGVIDGNGCTLKNIKIKSPTQGYLIYGMEKGIIKNLKLSNLSIQGDDSAYVIQDANNSQLNNVEIAGELISVRGKASIFQFLKNNSQVEGLQSKLEIIAKEAASGVAENVILSSLKKINIQGSIKTNIGSGVSQIFNGTADEISVDTHIVANKCYGFTSAADKASIRNLLVTNVLESESSMGSDVVSVGILQDANKGTRTTLDNVIVNAKLIAKRGMTYPTVMSDSVNVTTNNVYYLADLMNQIPLTLRQSEQSLLSQDVNKTVKGFSDFETAWSEQEKAVPVLKIAVGKVSAMPLVQTVMFGEGTALKPYLVQTPEQLQLVKYGVKKNFKLEKDIDLKGINWIPVGFKDAPFMAEFDGAGHTISNVGVKYNKNVEWLSANIKFIDFGLFGAIKTAKVHDLTLMNCAIVSDYDTEYRAGTLAGSMDISEVYNVSVLGDNTVKSVVVSGLVGVATNSKIKSIFAKSTLEGDSSIGGILGKADKTTIESAYTIVKANGTNKSIGGIVGNASNQSTLYKCYANVEFTGRDEIGGVVGTAKLISIIDCGANGHIQASNSANGIVGKLLDLTIDKNTIEKVYSAVKVKSVFVENSYLTTIAPVLTVKNTFVYDPANHTKLPNNARTLEQLRKKETFTGFDFTSNWSSEENLRYPLIIGSEEFIKQAIDEDIVLSEILLEGKLEHNTINLKWSSATPFNLYKVYQNGKVIYEGTALTYTVSNFSEGEKLNFVVEGIVNESKKMKSNVKEIIVTLFVPENLRVETKNDQYILKWDCQSKDCTHVIEVNSIRIGVTKEHEYILDKKIIKKENVIRVMNQKGNQFSKWSTPFIFSLVSPDFKGVRVVELERKLVNGKMTISAQVLFSNIEKPYSGYFIIKYDSSKFKIDESSIKEAFDASNVYIKTSIIQEKGILKILFTKKGENATLIQSLIKFDVLSLKNMSGKLDFEIYELADDDQLLIDNVEALPKEIIPLIED